MDSLSSSFAQNTDIDVRWVFLAFWEVSLRLVKADLLPKEKKMSARSIGVTLAASTTTALVCATVGYSTMSAMSKWLHSVYVPMDACVVIAISAACVGLVAYQIDSILTSNESNSELEASADRSENSNQKVEPETHGENALLTIDESRF